MSLVVNNDRFNNMGNQNVKCAASMTVTSRKTQVSLSLLWSTVAHYLIN